MSKSCWVKSRILNLFIEAHSIWRPGLIEHLHSPRFGPDHNAKLKSYKHQKRNARNTLFLALSLTLTTLCGIHFQCVVPTWISSNKRVSVREGVKKRVSIALLNIKIMSSKLIPIRSLKF